MVRENFGFILIALAATTSLVCTLIPVSYEYHFYTRVLMFLAIIAAMLGWRRLKLYELATLVATAIIYNPIVLIQLGSAVAWTTVASLVLGFSMIKILDKPATAELESD